MDKIRNLGVRKEVQIKVTMEETNTKKKITPDNGESGGIAQRNRKSGGPDRRLRGAHGGNGYLTGVKVTGL